LDIIVSRGDLPRSEKYRLDQSFVGNFRVGTAISVHEAPKFLYPHVSIRKKAKMVGESTVLFLINVTNDGNKPLKSINVSDSLPEGLVFINSSIRPEVNGQAINWSVPSLDISRTLTIKLNAKIEDISRTYTNTVSVKARYEEQILQDTNSTHVDPSFDILPCCIGINESINASKVFNVSRSDGYWQEWRPAPCLNATSQVTDCFKYIEEYYNELDSTEGTEKARSSYDVP
jgi:uncharacterized repeat protein (TIGR01451 family)